MRLRRLNSLTLKNQKGMFSVEYVMSFLIFILLFSFIFDLTLIVAQRNRATNILQSMVRVVQVQSGLETTVPTYFPSVGNSYLTTSDFIENSHQLFSNVGIDDSTIQIELSGISAEGSDVSTVIESGTDVQLKYKTPFTLKLSYQYSFSIWSQFVPGLESCEQTLTSVGLAEYKQNFDEWEGE